MDGHHVALGLHALGDECLLPRQVAYLLVPASRTQSGREHQDVVVALEAGLHHGGEVAALAAGLVDGYAERCQSGQVHQQVVDQIAEVIAVVAADDGSECHAVDAAHGVVRHEGVASPVVLCGHVLFAFHLQLGVKKLQACLQPGCALQVACVPQKLVALVFMGNLAQPVNGEARYPTGFLAQLVIEYLLDIDRFFGNNVHVVCRQIGVRLLTTCKSNTFLSILCPFVC